MKGGPISIIIPVRSLRDGKTRLSSVLSKCDRYELNRRFFINTLDVATSLIGLSSVVVVSRCKDVGEVARTWGVQYLFEITKGGLNPALSRASEIVRSRGIKKVLVLASDLPLLNRTDLRLLIAKAGRNGGAIAPDRCLRGTNALCVPAGGAFKFRFGADSFGKHKIAAQRCGIRLYALPRCSLSFDVDWPRDFSQLCIYESDHGVARLTRGLGVANPS